MLFLALAFISNSDNMIVLNKFISMIKVMSLRRTFRQVVNKPPQIKVD